MPRYTAYSIGNPLVDYITEVDEDIVADLELSKGNFHLFSKEEALNVLKRVEESSFKIVPGGAAANTMCGILEMGGVAFLSGGIGDDDFGNIFQKSLDISGVSSGLKKYDDPTGFVVVLVTPDAERTFVVYPGASYNLKPEELDFEIMQASSFLYFTGYQFEPEGLRSVITSAAEYCKKTLTTVVMNLGDSGIVERSKDEIKAFVREYADILIANETEAREYAEDEDEERALDRLAEDCDCVFLTLGEKGSLIRKGDKTFRVASFPVESVDTTGAGDMYAAGALFGMDKGFSFEYTGRIASYASSLVIQQKGARLGKSIAREIRKLGF